MKGKDKKKETGGGAALAAKEVEEGDGKGQRNACKEHGGGECPERERRENDKAAGARKGGVACALWRTDREDVARN